MNGTNTERGFSLTLFDGGAGGAGSAGGAGNGGAPSSGGAGDGNGPSDGAQITSDAAAGSDETVGVVSDDAKARRDRFDALINGEYKDLYAEKTQKMIDRRFRQTKELEEREKQAAPILERLSQKYGQKDPAKLLEAIDNDDAYYEEEAEERGMTVDQLKAFKRLERENESFRKAAEEQEKRDKAREIYSSWMREAEEVKTVYPQFDLDAECANEDFLRLLQANVDVKTAYEVVHRDELISGALAETARKTREAVVNDIRSRGMRPSENGVDASAAAVTKPDVNKMTKADREEIERRVLRGERIVL